ncbi:MAG TPA: hypothetical protein VFN13_09985 [Rudaea sp.]|nr:hypothetical protein [Rudaea sp.]
MTRLFELLIAIVIVLLLGVVFAVALPDHRHVERSVVVSSPARLVFDVVDGFHTYPSWNPFQVYDPKTQLTYDGPAMGPGATVNWYSNDDRVGNGSLTIVDNPPPEQDRSVTWAAKNNWTGDNKKFSIDLEPSENGKTVKVTMGYDVDYGWDLIGRISGLYLQGEPATQIQIQLTRLQNMLSTFPNVDYSDQEIQVRDVAAVPVIYIPTTAKRNLDDIADAEDKALDLLRATVKKDKLNVTGPARTITTNWGDQNYDFDVALPIDNPDAAVTDPVVLGTGYEGKALATSFTGTAVQLPLSRLKLKAYAYTHGYLFDESSEGKGRFFDENTTTDPNAASDQQTYTVYLPIQSQ